MVTIISTDGWAWGTCGSKGPIDNTGYFDYNILLVYDILTRQLYYSPKKKQDNFTYTCIEYVIQKIKQLSNNKRKNWSIYNKCNKNYI